MIPSGLYDEGRLTRAEPNYVSLKVTFLLFMTLTFQENIKMVARELEKEITLNSPLCSSFLEGEDCLDTFFGMFQEFCSVPYIW